MSTLLEDHQVEILLVGLTEIEKDEIFKLLGCLVNIEQEANQ
jgi:hypothetical protein